MADNNYIKFKSGTLSQVTSNLGKPDTQISVSTDITSIFKGDLNLTNRVIDASLFNNTLGLRKIDASGNYDSEFINMDFARPYNSGNGILVDNSTGTISLDPSYEMFEIVSALPTTNIDKNKIYLVPKQDDSSVANNIYTEYHYLGSGTWEIFGDRQADIASSLKIADVSLYEYPVDDISVGDPYDTAFSKLQSQILYKQIYIPVTHAELTDLRDNGQLVPGAWYRITDYTCTTTQPDTSTAGHDFDILVMALDEQTLSEEGCKAVLDESDGYFENYNAKLSAWQIWYCLDNDRTRFAWADNSLKNPGHAEFWFAGDNQYDGWSCTRNIEYDVKISNTKYYAWQYNNNLNVIYYTISENPSVGDTLYIINNGSITKQYIIDDIIDYSPHSNETIGKGVIYRMIDEWDNDCPYDFKNILFIRTLTEGEFDEDNGTDTWVYTFNATDNGSTGEYESEDGSLIHYLYNDEGYYEYTNNKILPYFNPWGTDDGGYDEQRELNNNVMLGVYDNSDNSYPYFSCNISFGLNCKNNTLGNQNYNNIFKNGCEDNILGGNCYSNIFEGNCISFVLKNLCYNNQFKFSSHHNTLYNNCHDNIIGSYSYHNTFNANSYNNKIGNQCQQNVIGQYCYGNTIGNNCTNNRIAQGNQASPSASYYNTIKDNCANIVLYLNCTNNIFESNCSAISLNSTSSSYNVFQMNCSNITTSNSAINYSVFEAGCNNINVTNGLKSYITVKNNHHLILDNVGYRTVILEYCNPNGGGNVWHTINLYEASHGGGEPVRYIGRNSNNEVVYWNPADHVIPTMAFS